MGTRTLSLGWNRRLTKWEMAVTGTKPEEFRRLAQECRATAQTVSTEQARAEMLAMAEVCDRAAELAPAVNGTKKPGWGNSRAEVLTAR
jgi:hypothetical protein